VTLRLPGSGQAKCEGAPSNRRGNSFSNEGDRAHRSPRESSARREPREDTGLQGRSLHAIGDRSRRVKNLPVTARRKTIAKGAWRHAAMFERSDTASQELPSASHAPCSHFFLTAPNAATYACALSK